jgi:two-component system, chemotaxis family, protein-glutamate methylesterase/glutaminase
VVAALPADFPVPVCVVIHTAPHAPGIMADVLARETRLRVSHPRDGERLESRHIYVAPPDRHLLVEPDRLRITRGPRENRFRPAIDPLFRSAAQVYGPGTIGVILSGDLDDGTSGLDVIKRLGGVAIVQNPAEALYPSMPQSAIDHVAVDHIASVAELAPLLVDLTAVSAEPQPRRAVPADLEVEVKIAKEQNPVDAGLEQIGRPSRFACPECHGVLLQLNDSTRIRFRCHTGHAYSVDSLAAAISEGIDESLWNSMRSLEEARLPLQTLAAHVQERHGSAGDAQRLLAQAEEARRHSETIRELVNVRAPLATENDAAARTREVSRPAESSVRRH